jgi:hypothetical protein
VLPAKAAGIGDEWPTVRQICRVRRWRRRKADGKWQKPQEEIIYLITSLPACEASPKAILQINRGHVWYSPCLIDDYDLVAQRIRAMHKEMGGWLAMSNGIVSTTLAARLGRPCLDEKPQVYPLLFHARTARMEKR